MLGQTRAHMCWEAHPRHLCTCRFVGGLTSFHSVLVLRNQTTYEHFRHKTTASDNPYDLGPWRNIQEACCLATPPRFGPLGEDEEGEAVGRAEAELAATPQRPAANGGAGADTGHVWTLGSPRSSLVLPREPSSASAAAQDGEGEGEARGGTQGRAAPPGGWSGSPGVESLWQAMPTRKSTGDEHNGGQRELDAVRAWDSDQGDAASGDGGAAPDPGTPPRRFPAASPQENGG